jgi:FtsP/CotA-like multicopper oxidase with cupredoxin domain
MSALSRRSFLSRSAWAGASVVVDGCAPRGAAVNPTAPLSSVSAAVPSRSGSAAPKADYELRIATGLVELANDRIVSTTLYNGQFPGPLLRLQEGKQVTVDIHNDTDTPELVHWHGQAIPSEVDGSTEEGTPFVPPKSTRRVAFMPRPSGFRFYHTHVVAGPDLGRGTYTGQAGPVYVEPKNDAGAYDRVLFLVLKEFEPFLSHGGDMAMDSLAGAPNEDLRQMGKAANASADKARKGFEVDYTGFAINGRMLGHGEPLRVRQGERVLLHVLNASATEIRSLALPGHTFRVVALDGNPVPTPANVPVLWLGNAERVSAIVEMNAPGVWVLGDLADDDREHGMGIVVEYADRKGDPAWAKPNAFRWDYSLFGKEGGPPTPPDETIEMLIVKRNAAAEGFNLWTLNGEAFSMATMKPMYTLHAGRRYRLRFRNASDDVHPLHLHRHSFELTRIAGKATAGVIKDVVMLGGYQELELDFVADNPGPTLFHCHQQLHMDFGFMAMFEYAT